MLPPASGSNFIWNVGTNLKVYVMINRAKNLHNNEILYYEYILPEMVRGQLLC
jgi:hypothetical protein